MSLTGNSWSLYRYVSFEDLGSHGAGVEHMGQSRDFFIVRMPLGS